MSISLKQAFCSVAQDAHWVSKVLIGSLLLFFPSFVYIFPGIRRLIFDPMNYYLIALFFADGFIYKHCYLRLFF